ncbi:hypothetical protein PHYPSEUDO_015505 [Phytophthora pseudosyringae]|uniref:MARVEL domain-containing protein n=1 Tax=Phytophthora pseudosyringae TaxID=221518 RepID=A0A8T1VYV6_9STRA|nr:hypothetical protein PHYPSEUDO_015505 [Phytophthora pseudosyringae]
MIGLLSPTMLARTRLALRSAQFLCCLLGLSFVAAGGVTFHSSNFVLLMNYTGMLYTLWSVVAVEVFNYCGRLSTRVEQGIDAVLAFVLLLGGICLAASDYVSHCDLVGHCHNLKAAVAFTFLGMFCFLASLALAILASSKPASGPSQVPGQYHMEVTPTEAQSPVEGLDSPGTKV